MIKVIKLDNETVRVVRGALVTELSVDWTLELSELRKLVEFGIGIAQDNLPAMKKHAKSDWQIHEGANHFDIIKPGKGSLNLLTVENHFYDQS